MACRSEGISVPGPQELLIIGLVALFVLGPERLPEAARAAARTLARIRRYGVTATQDLRGIADLGEIETEVQELRRELNRTRSELRRAMRDTVATTRPRIDPPTLPAGSAPTAPTGPDDELEPASGDSSEVTDDQATG
jgi:sec-independent protein translocase protein TatB